MILGGKYIRHAFDEGIWTAYRDGQQVDSSALKIGPNSIDVSLSNGFMWVDAASKTGVIDVYDEAALTTTFEEHESIVLEEGDFVLASTRERFNSNKPLSVLSSSLPDLRFKQDIDGRSTMGRLGVACHVTAGYGDYGFQGTWVLELKNLSRNSIRLHAGMRIAQVTFIAVLGPTNYNGSYTNQVTTQPPRLGRERFEMEAESHSARTIGLIER
jgi:dCTP deaminase